MFSVWKGTTISRPDVDDSTVGHQGRVGKKKFGAHWKWEVGNDTVYSKRASKKIASRKTVNR